MTKKQLSRQKIIHSAIRLFSRSGFEKVTIDEIMQDAKLTRGAFYSHFKTKAELYQIAISRALQQIPQHYRQLLRDDLKTFVEGYLDAKNTLQCPLAFFSNDIVNQEPQVKATYSQAFNHFVTAINYSIKDESLALEIATILIGTITLARTMDCPTQAEKIMTQNKQRILQRLLMTMSG